MSKFKPYSASFLSLEGFLLITMGVYFVCLRPSLLPEDTLYIGSSLSEILKNIPGIPVWLHKVFLVMGGYIFTTGLLTIYVAQTTFRTRTRGAFAIILLAGISSIGSMTIINFIIQSDSKWILLAFTFPWLIALILYSFHK